MRLDREAQARLEKVLDFKNITPDKGVAAVRKTWQFAMQLTKPNEHVYMTTQLRDFFAREYERLKSQ